MRPAGSASTECRSAPTSPPARWRAPRASQTSPAREDDPPTMSEISEPQTSEQVLAEELEEIEEMDTEQVLVGIIMGSKNDMDKMLPAEKYLSEQGISCEVRV